MMEAGSAAPAWPRVTVAFRAVRYLVRAVLRVFFRFRVEGLDGYPSGSAVLVANHPSALDPLFVAAAVPDRVLFIAAAEFLSWPVLGWAMKAYGCIPVRRGEVDASAVRAAVRALAAGVKVGVFPEGQVAPEPLPVRRGAGVIAARAGVRVVPVAVIGSDRVFPIGALVPRPGRVTVRIGLPQTVASSGREGREAATAAAIQWIRAQRAARNTTP
jgi:1-acyl-sn-glycerol-3-phosphate acyltransferase